MRALLKQKQINPFVCIIVVVYALLGLMTLNNCYFCDVIQQVSKEGHWFYEINFSSFLIPHDNFLNITSTGYHPPLMATMTAALWKVFGQSLWVSHAFTVFWATLLIYHSWKLISNLFPRKYAGGLFLIVLLEPTVLSQFIIASPDCILLSAFVIAIRGVLERRPVLLGVSVFFLCGVNMRGVFVGVFLFFTHLYFDVGCAKGKYSWSSFRKTLIPYLPTLALLIFYYIYYFSQSGWFFEDSPYSDHYSLPHTFRTIVAHFLSFFFRSLEFGRFVVWGLALYFVFFMIKKRKRLSLVEKTLGLFVLLMNGLYFLFIFISQMPFSPRYFMPQFFVLTLLVGRFVINYFESKNIKWTFVLVLLFTLTGNLWIYPEKLALPWDTTLAHLPYYELRKECFDFIDEQGYDYHDLSAGFCLYSDRGFIELANYGKEVVPIDKTKRYFIYSNISNLDDDFIDELKDPQKWEVIKSFAQWPITITLYENKGFDVSTP